MYDHRYLDDRMQNPHGVIQRACNLCGDCITGCNVGAKNTLVANYLPEAKYLGSEIYTQIEVKRIQRSEIGYRLDLEYVDDSSGQTCVRPISITSDLVILGLRQSRQRPALAGIPG